MKHGKLSLIAILALSICAANGKKLRHSSLYEELLIKNQDEEYKSLVGPLSDKDDSEEPEMDHPYEVEDIGAMEISVVEKEDDGDNERRLAGGKSGHNLYVENHCYDYRWIRMWFKYAWKGNTYTTKGKIYSGYRYWIGYTDQRDIRYSFDGWNYEKTRMEGGQGNYVLRFYC